MLITVGVILDTMRQIEAFLLQRHYDGFSRRAGFVPDPRMAGLAHWATRWT